MIVESASLLFLGFLVGLSGALIPGPLLVYTISQAVKEGRWAGFKVIVGHAIVEILILLFLFLGVSQFMTSTLFVKTVSLLGGLFLLYMAYNLWTKSFKLGELKDAGRGAVAGGIMFTALNPSFPVWWATLGSRLLIEGFTRAGTFGALIVVVGHWIADFGYFILVSFTVAVGSKRLLEDGGINVLRKILAVFLLGIGGYFMYSGII